jgi:hypothetical protein
MPSYYRSLPQLLATAASVRWVMMVSGLIIFFIHSLQPVPIVVVAVVVVVDLVCGVCQPAGEINHSTHSVPTGTYVTP